MLSFRKLWMSGAILLFIGLGIAMGEHDHINQMDIPTLLRSIMSLEFIFTGLLLGILAFCLKDKDEEE